MTKGAKDRVLKYAVKKDGTYNQKTGKAVQYKNGYQFSFVRDEAFKQLNGDEWDLLTEHIINSVHSKEHIGVFEGKAETSFRTETGDEAMYFARLFNQQSILDWEAKTKGASWETFLITNDSFDENKEVDYDNIIRKVLQIRK